MLMFTLYVLITNFIGVRANYNRLILPLLDYLLIIRQLEVLGRWIGPSPTNLSIESLDAVPHRFPRLLLLLLTQIHDLLLFVLRLIYHLSFTGTKLDTHPSSRQPSAPRRCWHRRRRWILDQNQPPSVLHQRLRLSPS